MAAQARVSSKKRSNPGAHELIVTAHLLSSLVKDLLKRATEEQQKKLIQGQNIGQPEAFNCKHQ
ncbi:MAG: hypothetical protein A2W80_18910 [Candidatus Riflebacteria bacterium GWC2_50_8]|nr:MAG: hypothetical protein A2W80_18910 [Candidatus Riflebacteria bacterium GWC2_50_8]